MKNPAALALPLLAGALLFATSHSAFALNIAMLLIGATFASAAWTQARRGHVAIDALGHILPPAIDRARRRLAETYDALRHPQPGSEHVAS